VTPLRAILEELSGSGPVTMLYRVRDQGDLVFKRELDTLTERRGVRVHYLVGTRGDPGPNGSLGAATIGRLVPDIAGHDVYLCGPTGLMTATAAAVRMLGVPPERIHQERFFD
jgi:ferredoxin-NADP reductase